MTDEKIDLLDTTDASLWAKEFVRYKVKNNWSIDDIDEGLMLAWFANAMFTQEMADDRKHKQQAA